MDDLVRIYVSDPGFPIITKWLMDIELDDLLVVCKEYAHEFFHTFGRDREPEHYSVPSKLLTMIILSAKI